MAKLERRQKILLGILVVLGAIAVYRLLGSPGGPLGEASGEPAGTGGLGADQQLILGLPELKVHGGVLEQTYNPQRDLFDFSRCQAEIKAEEDRQRRQRAQKDLQKKRREAADQQRMAQQDQQERTPRVVKPRAPEPSFTYLGYLGRLADPIAIFEKRGSDGEIVLAKVGDVVETEFVVKEIDWDRVELGFTRPEFADGEKTLPMKGAQS